MSNPRLAILIPAYNAQDTIYRALQSIPDQDWVQVIICDDASRPALQVNNIFEHASFSVHQLAENSGCNAAMNYAGQQLADSIEFLIELDADDEFIDHSILANMIELFDRDPQLDLVWGNMQVVGEQNYIRKYPANFDPWITTIKNPLAATTMMRRTSWQQAGASWGARPQHQDWYMWLCFARINARGKNINKIVYKYQISQSGLNLSNKSASDFRKQKTLQDFTDLDPKVLKAQSSAPRILKWSLQFAELSLPLSAYRKKHLQAMAMAAFWIKDFQTFKMRSREFIQG